MDDRRFDHLTRLLNSGNESRRGVLRGLAAAVLAATLTLPALAVAAKDTKRNRCNGRKQIGQKCERENGRNCKCLGGARCRGGRCRCVNGERESGGICARRPSCGPAFSSPETCAVDNGCCSDRCDVELGFLFCLPSNRGEKCLSTDDCNNIQTAEPLECRGFRCKPA
ncbi:MAG: EB domain-containing protein [Chloroflexota bacterium]|nr:EB domain-containing protein [Chloroflexota bacterium]